jgi:TPR repeat protein
VELNRHDPQFQRKLAEAAKKGDANATFRLARLLATGNKPGLAFKLYKFAIDLTEGISR